MMLYVKGDLAIGKMSLFPMLMAEAICRMRKED